MPEHHPGEAPQTGQTPPHARRRKLRWLAIAVPLVLLLALVIATVVNGHTRHKDKAASGTVAAGDAATAQPDLTWGQRFTWQNGLTVQVEAPAPYTPSQNANMDPDRSIILNITLTNGGTTPYQFNWTVFGPNATFNGEAANSIVDADRGVGVPPLTTIAPGQSYTYQWAFAATEDPGVLRLEFQPDFGGQKAIFTGTA
ncbi:hypothetical protein ORV05_02625 [Amycolatopsis cynarae]|uniref:DUF4352 domain-containing protein n=1 Tax=Amycolatopsis cynarae TaxID=2995223 RepID=A0ABY7B5M9_9PSEU|nr:hypothetical protein [Amycolatopsis sp. HUAS 11-8]WAL66729.1 hypothetical protein ORV05_02625 [Amycolatopsis sp. HUAS 11-8]